MKTLSLLGSTGSIGLNTLKIVRTHPECFRVAALAAKQNSRLLYRQAVEFRPKQVCLFEAQGAAWLEKKLRPLGIPVLTGPEGLEAVSTLKPVDLVVCAVVGAIGLKPLFAAIQAGKHVAIANKEPLVMAGQLLVDEARRRRVSILPIDSEHSALWQCLEGRRPETVKKLILTSSGGPFRSRKKSFLSIQPDEALKHPRWKMGPKITIDSATMMNKGLEVIEAVNLFGVTPDRVDVLVHPESIVHGLVEFIDGSQLAHLGITDMRLPIQYALSYPERLNNHLPALDLAKLNRLHFEKPDRKKFPCIDLGFNAARTGGTQPAILNAANEIAVDFFLNRRIRFTDIAAVIEETMAACAPAAATDLETVLAADGWARETARHMIEQRFSKKVRIFA